MLWVQPWRDIAIKKGTCAVASWICLAFSAVCLAQPSETPPATKEENAELRARVEQLEKQLVEVKQTLQQSPRQYNFSEDDLKKIQALIKRYGDADKKGRFVTSTAGVDAEFYGRVKLDASYDSARVDNGNFARWVESKPAKGSDNEFNMTARDTRLGVRLKSTDTTSPIVTGRLEIDFYGDGAENKPEVMMRHAYVAAEWPECRFTALAGQTSDIISPLYPDTLNNAILRNSGNLGHRRPMLAVAKTFPLAEKTSLKLEVAATRDIGRTTGFDPGDSGEDSGFPALQSRASVSFPVVTEKPTVVGVSGHWAREEFDKDSAGNHKNLLSWSLNLDLTQPITPWFGINAEAFTGQDLDAYYGGINQGVDTTSSKVGGVTVYSRIKEVSSQGGWLAATFGPFGKWRTNIGAGLDDPDDSDLSADTARTYNSYLFGNVIYDVTRNLSVGLELSQMHTEYKDERAGDNVRMQGAVIYQF